MRQRLGSGDFPIDQLFTPVSWHGVLETKLKERAPLLNFGECQVVLTTNNGHPKEWPYVGNLSTRLRQGSSPLIPKDLR